MNSPQSLPSERSTVRIGFSLDHVIFNLRHSVVSVFKKVQTDSTKMLSYYFETHLKIAVKHTFKTSKKKGMDLRCIRDFLW